MEHLRIAQWDILEFVKNREHVSPDWPEGYWSLKDKEATVDDWFESVKVFIGDLREVERLVEDTTITLTDPLPHAEDYTYLREIMLVADHNAYHIGQLVLFAKSV